ncbi:MAG: hypothetical protein D8M62_02810 [Proteobacteria bacterium]|nr:hypothetical protein [Pseudomonadota bacterium]
MSKFKIQDMTPKPTFIQSVKDQVCTMKILSAWVVSIVIVSHVIDIFNVNITSLWLIEVAAKYIPSVNAWSEISVNPILTKTVWVYTIITSMVIFFFLPRKISKKYIYVYSQSAFAYFIFGILLYITFGILFSAEIFNKEVNLQNVPGDYQGVPSKMVWVVTSTTGISLFCGFIGLGFLMSLNYILMFIFANFKNLYGDK